MRSTSTTPRATWKSPSGSSPSGRGPDGRPLLLADEIGPDVRNVSFEREFGKIIARLDLLAGVVAEKYRRAAISYVQNLVGGTFLQFLPVR